MIQDRIPPLPTLGLAVTFSAIILATPFLISQPETGGLQAKPDDRPVLDAGLSEPAPWSGPRPETKREILSAPLFTEDRKLPLPAGSIPLEPKENSDVAPEKKPPEQQTVNDTFGMNPPDYRASSAAAKKNAEVRLEQDESEPEAPLNLPKLRLIGTFIVEGKGIARALLVNPESGDEEFWIDEGGRVEDWVLTIVSPEAVYLERGSEGKTLELWEEELMVQ